MPTPERPRELQWRVFLGTDARRRRLVTAGQLRGAAWLRLRHDVYADARLDRDHELACRAAALRLPADAVLAGPSAAFLHGVPHAAAAHDDVHVIVPPRVRLSARKGVMAHTTALKPAETARLGDLLVTTPARTAWDVANWLDLATAVSVIDGLLADDRVTRAGLAAMVRDRHAERGWRRAEAAFALADAGAQSAPESRLRVRLVIAGLPRPVTQHPVPLATGITLHPDLAWPEFKVAVEYDGAWHAGADQFHRDRRRLNQLVAAGWLVLHVTADRMRRDFGGVLREVRAALTARGWRPGRA